MDLRKFIWACAAVGILLFADSAAAERRTSGRPTSAPTVSTTPDGLKGLVVVSSRQQVQTEAELRDKRGITVGPGKELDILRGKAFEKAISPLWGKPALSLSVRTNVIDAIYAFYKENGRPLVEVALPEQVSAEHGVLQVFVLEGKLGKPVTVEGNKWFKTNLFTSQINLKTNEVINERELMNDINWLNQSQFRHVGVVYRPGAQYGQTDVSLAVTDRFPVSVLVGYENTGVEVIGEDRVVAGLDYGNVFGLDHRLSYRFNSDFDFEKLLAHFASYEIPFPWQHSLRVYGGYAEIDAELPGGAFSIEGTSYQLSTRYDIDLPALGRARHQLSLGYDYKNSDNQVLFGVTVVNPTGGRLEVGHFASTYTLGVADRFGTNTFRADGFYSPGNFWENDNDAIYTVFRPGSESDYVYGRFFGERTTRLWREGSNAALLTVRASGQVSADRLIQSEQMVFGGMNSVRGFREFLILADEGFIVSAELLSPAMRFFGKRNNFNEGLRVLGFFDYGATHEIDPRPADIGGQTMSSAGLGLRYYASRYLSVRFDYGFQIHRPSHLGQHIDPDRNRAHASVTLSY